MSEAQYNLYVFSPSYRWWAFLLYLPHSSIVVLKQFIKHYVRINQNAQNAESSHQQWHFPSSPTQGWFRQFCWQNLFNCVQLCTKQAHREIKDELGDLKILHLPGHTIMMKIVLVECTSKIHLMHGYTATWGNHRDKAVVVCIYSTQVQNCWTWILSRRNY